MKVNNSPDPSINVLEYMRTLFPTQHDSFDGITTVAEWAACWLNNYCTNIKKSTLAQYADTTELHINRVLGDVPLAELTNEDVQLFLNSLTLGIGISKPLSAKSVKNIHGVLHKCLETAVSHKLIPENPASLAVLPKREKPEIRPLTTQELSRFLNHIQGHAKGILFTVAVFTGLREGELMGLTWDCIDFSENSIHVYRQLAKIKREYQFTSLKNSKPRTIYPAPFVMGLLMEQKRRSAYRNSDFVFLNESGNPLTHAAVYNSFKREITKVGCSEVRFHDLRHTYAVISIQAGIDVKTLQYNMGHHSAAFTLDVYGHCYDTMKRKSSEQMQQFIANLGH